MFQSNLARKQPGFSNADADEIKFQSTPRKGAIQLLVANAGDGIGVSIHAPLQGGEQNS